MKPMGGGQIGCLIFVVAGAAFVLLCVSKLPTPEERDDSRQRAVADRASKVAAISREMCTPALDKLGGRVATKFDGTSVFVDPGTWSGMKYDNRVGFAVWYSACFNRGETIWIKHGNTGKTLATYEVGWGYSAKE